MYDTAMNSREQAAVRPALLSRLVAMLHPATHGSSATPFGRVGGSMILMVRKFRSSPHDAARTREAFPRRFGVRLVPHTETA